MPKISEFYPSNYLRAADLGGTEKIATIDRVESVEFDDGGRKRTKPVVHFRNPGLKGLVANKTNCMRIAAAVGTEDTDAWPGKQVVLYPDLVEFQGKVSEAVRVKRMVPPASTELNDAIPF
jgi:hypothetical protein